MSQLLLNHPGLVAIAVLVALSFVVVALRALFRWSRSRANRMEHLQRSLEAIRWPDSTWNESSSRRAILRSAPR